MKYISKGNGWMLLAILLLFGCIPTVSHAKIVFTSKRDGDAHIYVMEDNGSNVRRITDSYDRHPRWFPDGKRILFERDLTWGNNTSLNYQFYIIDAKGRFEHRFMENHPTDGYPVLSPSGKQIAFQSGRAGEWDLYTYHLENGLLKQLTDHGWVNRIDWSPDGRQIAYGYGEAEGENIWTINADGSTKRRFSPRHKGDMILRRRGPRWSPSGKYIMYNEDQWLGDGNLLNLANWVQLAELLVVQNVRTGVREEHEFPLKNNVITGCWMGNDRTVLLPIKKDRKAPTANYEIYRYDLVSRKLTNLTNQPGDDYHPRWIRGTLAVFPAGKLTILWGQLKKVD